MTMTVNMILVMYVILCILSYDFNKLTMLYMVDSHESDAYRQKNDFVAQF